MKPNKPSHNYSSTYAEILLNREMNHVAEIGILNDVGLAMWSSLYPKASIYGFDLQLQNTQSNLNSLKSRGGFGNGKLSLIKLDQLHVSDTVSWLNTAFDFVIDDGYHSDQASTMTWKMFEPHLSSDAIYVVEDCKCEGLQKLIANEYTQYTATFKETSTVQKDSYLLIITKK